MSDSKRIAKNTLLLYFRMFLIMGVTLYTSRIVLKNLGVSDYGVYSIVGGIVSVLGFFNAAMSSATQRYLSFDIGKGNQVQLQKTFSVTLTIHFCIAVLALILAETIGLWYINYRMVFPDNRIYAVNIVYQFSIFTFLLNIVQVPYNALIIARERMKIYAYVSIIEAILKLGIVFLLVFGEDKLILYAILTFSVALIIRLIYQGYCRKEFVESKYKFEYDRDYFKELLVYSGWNLFGNLVMITRVQGVNIVFNLFLGTLVNAAYGITLQVQSAIQMFVNSFQMAINPQIIKKYALNEKNIVIQTMFGGVKMSFFLLLFVLLPLFFNLDFFLRVWLGNVPNLTTDFVKLIFIIVVIETCSNPFATVVTASGRIRLYHLIIGSINLLVLPMSYFFLKAGSDSVFVLSIGIFVSSILFIARLLFASKLLDVTLKESIVKIFIPNSLVFISSYLFIEAQIEYFDKGIILNCIIECLVILFFIWNLGLNRLEKDFVKSFIKSKV